MIAHLEPEIYVEVHETVRPDLLWHALRPHPLLVPKPPSVDRNEHQTEDVDHAEYRHLEQRFLVFGHVLRVRVECLLIRYELLHASFRIQIEFADVSEKRFRRNVTDAFGCELCDNRGCGEPVRRRQVGNCGLSEGFGFVQQVPVEQVMDEREERYHAEAWQD